jgi:photosystem II stability/assembly factor-like uncharacterized protein
VTYWSVARFRSLFAGFVVLLSLPCEAAQNEWSKILSLPGETPVEFARMQIVSDHRIGRLYVLTQGGTFYRTADGGVTWTSIAPTSLSDATRVMAVDPLDSNTVYRGSFKGLYKSTNGGVNWWRVDHGFPFVPYGLAVPSHQTVYASANSGIMRSEDGGASWSPAGFEGQSVSAIMTTRDSTLYAVVFRYLYKSADGGRSWIQVANVHQFPYNSSVHPHDSQLIYTVTPFQWSRVLNRTTNGGYNWTAIHPAIEGWQPEPCPPLIICEGGGPSVGSIVVDPQQTAVFYGSAGRLVSSSDAGITWRYFPGLPEGTSVEALTLDGDTLLAYVRGKTPGTSGVYEYTFTPPAPARRRAARR